MKKSVFIAAILGLSLVACKKENKTNTDNDAPKLNSLKMDENKSYTYLATNGDRAKITFQNSKDDQTITIDANNMKFVLDKKDGDADSEIFERNSVQAKLTKDSLIISQDSTVIPLVLER